jgi:hypothetical protein
MWRTPRHFHTYLFSHVHQLATKNCYDLTTPLKGHHYMHAPSTLPPHRHYIGIVRECLTLCSRNPPNIHIIQSPWTNYEISTCNPPKSECSTNDCSSQAIFIWLGVSYIDCFSTILATSIFLGLVKTTNQRSMIWIDMVISPWLMSSITTWKFPEMGVPPNHPF